MQTTDLMLNDLVYRKAHNEFHKEVPPCVVKIDGIETEMVTICPRSEYLEADEIEPIPLSTEILAKNCKSITKDGCRTYYEFSENFAVKQINNDNSFFFCEIKGGFMGKNEIDDWTWQQIDNFHELQHALRFVGLNEVADNLKV